MHKYLLVCLFSFYGYYAAGQVGLVKRALKQLSAKEYSKVEETLTKIKKKDSLYAGLFYTKAKLYIDNRFNQFNIDSAQAFRLFGRKLYDQLEAKEREKLARAGVDSTALDRLKQVVDSTAFERAKELNTESDYLFFLKNFEPTEFDAAAIKLRNARGFDNALQLNTYQAYRTFMDKYPESAQYKEAKKRYERLYFEKSTSDGKLSSFKKFLKAHPSTPYRDEAVYQIFRVLTADHSTRSYQYFRKEYQNSSYARLAEKFEYHLAKETNHSFSPQFFSDSLQKVRQWPQNVLFYLQNQRFGLMNLRGEVLTPAMYKNVEPEYLCDGLSQDVFISDASLYSKTGVQIISNVRSFQDLGTGLIAVDRSNGLQVFHKSGFKVLEGTYEDVKLLLGKFFALKSGGKWSLKTVSGIDLTVEKCDDIYAVGKFILFEKDNRLDIKVAGQLVQAADNDPIKYQYLFEDYELLDNGAIWLQSAYGEVIFDNRLNELIPYQKQEIDLLPFGYSVKTGSGFKILSDSFRPISKKIYTDLQHNQNYILASEGNDATLIRAENYSELGDYLKVELYGNQFAVGYRPDTLVVFGNHGFRKEVPFGERPTLLSSTDSKEFLKVTKDQEIQVIGENGDSYNLSGYDDFSALNDFLITTKNKKKGIYYSNNRSLPSEYDAVGVQDEGVTLLSNGKFGLYVKEEDLLIKPFYEERITKYGKHLFLGVRNNSFNFLDKNGQIVAGLNEATSVEFWQDSVALVRSDDSWKFYDIFNDQWEELILKSFTDLDPDSDERRIIALGTEGYGILSNKYGEIISLSFNDVVQIGPADRPIYFTEKHIEEAEFYVVIYFDGKGEVIRKQAFESEDYDLIYCDR